MNSIVLACLETLVKHEPRVYEILRRGFPTLHVLPNFFISEKLKYFADIYMTLVLYTARGIDQRKTF